jgi:membrane protease YdiL (CAAX protease family)
MSAQSSILPPDYDIDDSPEDYDRWPNLAPILRECGVTIGAAYHREDAAAKRYQSRYRRLVFIAALCGMLAVIFAIMQLSDLLPALPASWVYGGEVLAATVAVVAVIFGLWATFAKKWILEREKAERCRFLKFTFLINPDLWSGVPPAVRRQWLSARIDSLNSLDEEDLKRWAEREEVMVKDVPPKVPAGTNKEVLQELFGYYETKRLEFQSNYFDRQARRRYLWEKLSRVAPVVFFFLSILFALGHFVYDLVASEELGQPPSQQDQQDTFSVWLILLAACLPVVGAAVRTLRTAHEFGRNAQRFRATSNKLEQLANDLQNLAQADADPQAKLEVFQSVEKVLEAEHREWMRLMWEAEGF